jgi:hypothetical protein
MEVTVSTLEAPRSPQPYLAAAAPLVLVAALLVLIELVLRKPVGAESSAQIAAGGATIPGAILAVWVTQRSRSDNERITRDVTSHSISPAPIWPRLLLSRPPRLACC